MTVETEQDHASPGPARRRSRKLDALRLVVAAVVFVVALALVKDSGLIDLLRDREALDETMDELGWMAVGVYVLAWIPMLVLLNQTFVPTVAGGIMFGWAFGGLFATVGATVGSISQFLVVRYMFRGPAEALLLSRFPALGKMIDERGLSLLVFLRLIWAPAWLVNIACGVTRIRQRTFAAAFPALLPQALLICFLTESLYVYGWADIPPVRWATVAAIVVVSVAAYLGAMRRWPHLKISFRRQRKGEGA